MSPETIITLVKAGGIGGSLAFLWFGYKLLRIEQARETPRYVLLGAIAAFIAASFVFFVSGVLSDVAVRHAERIIDHVWGSYVDSRLVKVQFGEWGRSPDKKTIVFSLREDRFVPERYVPYGKQSEYKVIVAVRGDTGNPAMQGVDAAAFGPYDFVSRSSYTIALPLNVQRALGNGRVTYAVFGIPRTTIVSSAALLAFEPQKIPGLFVFYEASEE